MPKCIGERNFKKKGKSGFKNANPYWSNNERQKNEDKTKSSRRGRGLSKNHTKKRDFDKARYNATIVKNMSIFSMNASAKRK